jgi:transposase-like protein
MSSEAKVYIKIYKKCPECKSNKIVKNGHKNTLQRYKCKNCGFRFQSGKQTSRKSSSLLDSYLFKNKA